MTFHPAMASARMTCNACPEQWEGKLVDGRWFYFRYRSDVASLGLASTEWGAVEASFGNETVVGNGSLAGVFESAEQRSAVFAELYEVAK
jgi:hypothetical protein